MMIIFLLCELKQQHKNFQLLVTLKFLNIVRPYSLNQIMSQRRGKSEWTTKLSVTTFPLFSTSSFHSVTFSFSIQMHSPLPTSPFPTDPPMVSLLSFENQVQRILNLNWTPKYKINDVLEKCVNEFE